MDQITSDLLIGTVVDGKYRIDTLIGEGGMGKVFRATHLELNRSFALKVMRRFDQNNTNSTRISRFRREASALAKLSHPNIVGIVDFGILKPLPLPYIVMEYIEGQTLRKLLSTKGTLTENQAISITKQLCLGLHEAHTQGIIHRDLKPENIIIRELADGEFGVSVVDFGIAKFQVGQTGSLEDDIKTTGSPPGTLRYIAPEQFFKLPIDARTDIFSICLIFYEMLTGEVPPVMIGDFKTLAEMRPGATPELSQIIEKGLSRSPDDRPASALALKKSLEEIGHNTFIPHAKEKNTNRPVIQVTITKPPADTKELKLFNSSEKVEQTKLQHSSRNWIVATMILLSLLLTTGLIVYQRWPHWSITATNAPQLVTIKGGEFFMGSNSGDQYSQPAHSISVNSFQVARALITNRQYAEFIKATNHSAPRQWQKNSPPPDNLDRPITDISWNDAKAYCQWLAQQTGKPYRLLSEAEWEYLANNYTTFGIDDMLSDYLEWTSSEFTLYPESTLPFPKALQQTPTAIFRGKDKKIGNQPITDRMWQVKDYHDATLSFRVAIDLEH